MGRHRAEVRPRYGRIGALGAAVAVTLIAVAGASGAIPHGHDEPAAATSLTKPDRGAGDATDRGGPAEAHRSAAGTAGGATTPAPKAARAATSIDDDTALPPGSGTGRRIVFSERRQRVWLVGGSERILRTYLASGSVTDNLRPGSYEVYSRSRNAVGVDDSGTMEYFVRFTHGTAGAAIGFHTIPVDDGHPVQTVAQLGTPRSHGCIRQRRTDAVALWEFAPIGTTVVVTA